MKAYRPQAPRAAFALCAAALSAVTMLLTVYAPARWDSGFEPTVTLADTHAPPQPIEVAILPARIEVVGIREPNIAWALAAPADPNCKPAT